jgi:hypothetical protein
MTIMSTAKLEARIDALEAEVAAMKVQLAQGGTKTGWQAIVGTFPDDELTRRAEQYGREYRESLQPKAKKARGKRVRARHRSPQPVATRG